MLPRVFTRNGIGMLSSVLRSETAVEFNIRIMRATPTLKGTNSTPFWLKTVGQVP